MSEHRERARPARRAQRKAAALAALVAAVAGVAPSVARAVTAGHAMRPELAAVLATSADEPVAVLVTGATTDAALTASHAAGLRPVDVFEHLAVIAAVGSADAVRAVHTEPGVRRVDPDFELELLDATAHDATGVSALRDMGDHPELLPLRASRSTPYDGSGVSIAVVDSGFDTTHEVFVEDGGTKFDVHQRQLCGVPREGAEHYSGLDLDACSHWVPAEPALDDHLGHGTGVAGIAAGYERATPSGVAVSGVAPGARLVGLSIGTGPSIANAISALEWIVEHGTDPCGDGTCPPIRVVNNSYALSVKDDHLGRGFDPDAPYSRAARAVVDAGIAMVIAGGNDGGDGSAAMTNLLARNPAPGIISVGAYDDGNIGDRELGLAGFSSRGQRGDLGTYPDVVAPGYQVIGACSGGVFCTGAGQITDGAYTYLAGTSQSSPYVAGLIAQLVQADPSLTPAQLEDILEDTAYQGFIPADDLEPDTAGNADHDTSFAAGHGLADAVAALSAVQGGAPRTAPDPCPTDPASVSVTDATGDTTLLWDRAAESSFELDGHDITMVVVDATTDATTVTVHFTDVPDQAVVPMHTTVSGSLDHEAFEVDLDRSAGGDVFTPFAGDVIVDGSSVDPGANTATFVIRHSDGAAPARVGLRWAWSSVTFAPGTVVAPEAVAVGSYPGDADVTAGACPVYR